MSRRGSHTGCGCLGYILCFLLGFALGLHCRSHRTEAVSVEETETITYEPLVSEAVRETLWAERPVLRYHADTVIRYLRAYEAMEEGARDDLEPAYRQSTAVDSFEVLKDWLLTRQYHLDFSSDTLGTFLVDAEVERNQLSWASATLLPLARTVTHTRTIREGERRRGVMPWLLVGTSPQGDYQHATLGIDLRRSGLKLGAGGVRFDDKYRCDLSLGINLK